MCVRIAYAVATGVSDGPSIARKGAAVADSVTADEVLAHLTEVDYRSKDEVVRSLHLDPAPNRPPGSAADQARYDNKPGIAESSRDRQDDRVKGADRRGV